MDGRNKFLISGLWDMHVHLSYARPSALPAFVANGVTGIRDIGSDLAEIDRGRAQIEENARVGPVIVRAGPMLNAMELTATNCWWRMPPRRARPCERCKSGRRLHQVSQANVTRGLLREHIAPGKRADLVLLDANPLADIRNTRRINAVVARGRLLDRVNLDRLLREAVAQANQE